MRWRGGGLASVAQLMGYFVTAHSMYYIDNPFGGYTPCGINTSAFESTRRNKRARGAGVKESIKVEKRGQQTEERKQPRKSLFLSDYPRIFRVSFKSPGTFPVTLVGHKAFAGRFMQPRLSNLNYPLPISSCSFIFCSAATLRFELYRFSALTILIPAFANAY